MGFVTGFFGDEVLNDEVLPPWLSGIRCAGPEPEVGACRRSTFGDTSSCGTTQRLFCLSSRAVLRSDAALTSPILPMPASSSHIPTNAVCRSATEWCAVSHVVIEPPRRVCRRPRATRPARRHPRIGLQGRPTAWHGWSMEVQTRRGHGNTAAWRSSSTAYTQLWRRGGVQRSGGGARRWHAALSDLLQAPSSSSASPHVSHQPQGQSG